MKKSRKGKSGTANVHNMVINSTAKEIPGSLAGSSICLSSGK